MVIDFHSHVLPGVDDGSASVAESISMLRLEVEQGIHHVVATPHFYARYDSPESFLKKRDAAEELLRSRERPRLLTFTKSSPAIHYPSNKLNIFWRD